MPHSEIQDSRALGVGLIVVGAALLGVAGFCAHAAAEHMAAAAALCGPVARHCILCLASAGAMLASVGVVAAGMMLLDGGPQLRPARLRGGVRIGRRPTRSR